VSKCLPLVSETVMSNWLWYITICIWSRITNLQQWKQHATAKLNIQKKYTNRNYLIKNIISATQIHQSIKVITTKCKIY